MREFYEYRIFLLHSKRVLNFVVLMQWMLSKPFTPMAFLMGVPWKDCRTVAELIGLKTFANEFIAYSQLVNIIDQLDVSPFDLYAERLQHSVTFAVKCHFLRFFAAVALSHKH